MSEDTPLTTDEALVLMPLLTKSALITLRREGKGPKFGTFSNRVLYQRADVEEWYEAFKKKSFTLTRAVSRKPSVAKTGKATKNGSKDLLA
jgi:hypothetical protein